VTREEDRRRSGRDVPGAEEGGPDPMEDPILYLEEWQEEEKKG
jgi:hypothetical protein